MADLTDAKTLRSIISALEAGFVTNPEARVHARHLKAIAARLERPAVEGRLFRHSADEWIVGLDVPAREIVKAVGGPIADDMPVTVTINPA